MNELGNYGICTNDTNQDTYAYALQIIMNKSADNSVYKNSGVRSNQPKYVVGNCILEICDASYYLDAFYALLYGNPLADLEIALKNKSTSNVDFIIINSTSSHINDKFKPAYYAIWFFIGLIMLLNIVGMVIQYTGIGDITDKKNNV